MRRISLLTLLILAALAMASPRGAFAFDGHVRLSMGPAWSAGESLWRLTLGAGLRWESLPLGTQGYWFADDVTSDLRLQLQVPVQLRLRTFDGESAGTLRRSEWQGAEDALRVLRIVQLGQPHEPLYLRVGELANVRVGHRSVVDQLRNSVERDRFRWGASGSVVTRRGGVDVLVDSVVDPQVFGARLWLRPAPEEPVLRRLRVGTSLFADPSAPRRLELLPDGRYAVDARGRPRVEEETWAAVAGVEAAWDWWLTPQGGVSTTVDVNTLLGYGAGLHLALVWGATLADRWRTDGRAELRWIGPGYAPAYFGPLYELHRMAWRAIGDGTQRRPRLEWLATEKGAARLGGFGELGLTWEEALRAEVAVWEEQGQGGAGWWLRLETRSVPRVVAALWWVQGEAPRLSDAFAADGTLLLSETRVLLLSPIYVGAYYGRRFEADGEGQYRSQPEYGVMLGAEMGF